MSSGLQIFGPDGTILIDNSSSVGTILGYVHCNATDGSVSDARFANGRPFYIISGTGTTNYTWGTRIPPVASVSGNTLSWTYSYYSARNWVNADAVIIYGIR